MNLEASKEMQLFCLVLHNRKIIHQGIMPFPDKIFVHVCLRSVPAENLPSAVQSTLQKDIFSLLECKETQNYFYFGG